MKNIRKKILSYSLLITLTGCNKKSDNENEKKDETIVNPIKSTEFNSKVLTKLADTFSEDEEYARTFIQLIDLNEEDLNNIIKSDSKNQNIKNLVTLVHTIKLKLLLSRLTKVSKSKIESNEDSEQDEKLYEANDNDDSSYEEDDDVSEEKTTAASKIHEIKSKEFIKRSEIKENDTINTQNTTETSKNKITDKADMNQNIENQDKTETKIQENEDKINESEQEESETLENDFEEEEFETVENESEEEESETEESQN